MGGRKLSSYYMRLDKIKNGYLVYSSALCYDTFFDTLDNALIFIKKEAQKYDERNGGKGT